MPIDTSRLACCFIPADQRRRKLSRGGNGLANRHRLLFRLRLRVHRWPQELMVIVVVLCSVTCSSYRTYRLRLSIHSSWYAIGYLRLKVRDGRRVSRFSAFFFFFRSLDAKSHTTTPLPPILACTAVGSLSPKTLMARKRERKPTVV